MVVVLVLVLVLVLVVVLVVVMVVVVIVGVIVVVVVVIVVLILIRHNAPTRDLPTLVRTTQASQLYAICVLTSYQLLICTEFNQAQACIHLLLLLPTPL